MSDINYPITVDEKTLWALIHVGDAIIRNPQPNRFEAWEKFRSMVAKQCEASARRVSPASAETETPESRPLSTKLKGI